METALLTVEARVVVALPGKVTGLLIADAAGLVEPARSAVVVAVPLRAAAVVCSDLT